MIKYHPQKNESFVFSTFSRVRLILCLSHAGLVLGKKRDTVGIYRQRTKSNRIGPRAPPADRPSTVCVFQNIFKHFENNTVNLRKCGDLRLFEVM